MHLLYPSTALYSCVTYVRAIESGTFSMTVLTVVTIELLSLHHPWPQATRVGPCLSSAQAGTTGMTGKSVEAGHMSLTITASADQGPQGSYKCT
eukprot:3563843-Rhodomonas_salina.1